MKNIKNRGAGNFSRDNCDAYDGTSLFFLSFFFRVALFCARFFPLIRVVAAAARARALGAKQNKDNWKARSRAYNHLLHRARAREATASFIVYFYARLILVGVYLHKWYYMKKIYKRKVFVARIAESVYFFFFFFVCMRKNCAHAHCERESMAPDRARVR